MLWFGTLLSCKYYRPACTSQISRNVEANSCISLWLCAHEWKQTVLCVWKHLGFRRHRNIMSNDPFYNKFKWASEKTKPTLEAGTDYTSFPDLQSGEMTFHRKPWSKWWAQTLIWFALEFTLWFYPFEKLSNKLYLDIFIYLLSWTHIIAFELLYNRLSTTHLQLPLFCNSLFCNSAHKVAKNTAVGSCTSMFVFIRHASPSNNVHASLWVGFICESLSFYRLT